MANDFAEFADFLTIYIEEAHSIDGWYFPRNYHQHRDHTTIDDRIASMKPLLDRNPPFPVVSDVITDDANEAYGGLFERLYVIKDGVVELVGDRGPSGYDVNIVMNWLLKYSGGGGGGGGKHRNCLI